MKDKLRVGDPVVLIDDDGYEWAKAGDTGVVSLIDGDGDTWVVFDDGTNLSWCCMEYRLRHLPYDVPPALDPAAVEAWLTR